MKAATIGNMEQEGRLQDAVQQHFKPAWLQQNGLGGITSEGLNAVLAQAMVMLRGLEMADSSAESATMDCTKSWLGKRLKHWEDGNHHKISRGEDDADF